jgi:hypothetical protein
MSIDGALVGGLWRLCAYCSARVILRIINGLARKVRSCLIDGEGGGVLR